MTENKSKSNSSKPVSREISVRIRYESLEQVKLIKSAAARRGLGFNAFVRLITLGAAKNVMEVPPEDIVGRFAEPLMREPAA